MTLQTSHTNSGKKIILLNSGRGQKAYTREVLINICSPHLEIVNGSRCFTPSNFIFIVLKAKHETDKALCQQEVLIPLTEQSAKGIYYVYDRYLEITNTTKQ